MSTRASGTGPNTRFATAQAHRLDEPEPASSAGTTAAAVTPPVPRLLRRVLVDGKVSLLNFKYPAGRYLAGQRVEVVSRDGLVEVFHDGVPVATHARRHLPEQEERIRRQARAAAPKRPASEQVVVRKVSRNGTARFAGADYRDPLIASRCHA